MGLVGTKLMANCWH